MPAECGKNSNNNALIKGQTSKQTQLFLVKKKVKNVEYSVHTRLGLDISQIAKMRLVKQNKLPA